MTKTITLHVKGMHCKGCALGLQGALEALDGVSSVKASYPERTAVVCWSSDKPYEDILRKAVAGAGFEVEFIDE